MIKLKNLRNYKAPIIRDNYKLIMFSPEEYNIPPFSSLLIPSGFIVIPALKMCLVSVNDINNSTEKVFVMNQIIDYLNTHETYIHIYNASPFNKTIFKEQEISQFILKPILETEIEIK